MIRLAAKQDHQKDRASIVSKNAATGYWRSGRRSGKRLCGSRLAAILRDAVLRTAPQDEVRDCCRPHPEEAAHRSRACPTSATLKCRNRQQPISMRGRLEGWKHARHLPFVQ